MGEAELVREALDDLESVFDIDYTTCAYFLPDGDRILDFNSQLMSVNIGHGDQRRPQDQERRQRQATQGPVR